MKIRVRRDSVWSPGILNWSSFQSRDHVANRLTVLLFKAFVTCDGKLVRIEAELVLDGGVNVGDVVTVSNGVFLIK